MAEHLQQPRPPSVGMLRLCGEPAFLHADGRVVPIDQKDGLLLAYLALEGPTPRGLLAAFMWPDVDPLRARGSLRQRLFRLRRQVGFELLREGELTTLRDGLCTDVQASAQDPETAIAPLLGSFEWRGGGDAGTWLAQARARHAEARLEALRSAASAHEVEGRLAIAIGMAKRLIGADPLSEHAHRRLMRLHYLRGDRAAAIAAFEDCERVLKDELSTVPSAETVALLRTIEASGVVPLARSLGGTRRPPLVSVLRPPRLVGRECELRELAQAWQEERCFCVLGEAGMGKSRLLAEFAAQHGKVVSVQARPGDAAVPFALLARTLRAMREHLPEVSHATPAPALVALLPELALPGTKTGAPDRPALQTCVEQALLDAQACQIGGVLIDDLHFADEPSVAMLGRLICAPLRPGPPLGLASRAAQQPPFVRALAAAGVETGQVVEVILRPLDPVSLIQLLDSLDIPGLDVATWAPLLARHTGGNPLFVLETLKASMTGNPAQWAPPAGLSTPASIAGLFAHRLKLLTPDALALARVAAVAGSDFGPELAEDVLEVRSVDLASPWVELESAHFFSGQAFAHDLVYEAVLASIPEPVARRLHEAVARFLERQQAEAARVAGHWLRAERGAEAVPWLERAAQAALAAFERPAAAQFLETAARIETERGHGDNAFRLQAMMIELLQGFDSGPRHDEATLQLIALARTPTAKAQAQTLRAVYLHIVSRTVDALAAVELGEQAARQAGDGGLMSRLLNMRGIVLRRLGRARESAAVHDRAIALARAHLHADDLAAQLNNLALALTEQDEHALSLPHFAESARLQMDLPTRARVLNNMAIAYEETGGAESALRTRIEALALLAGQDGVAAARLNITHSLGANARRLLHFIEALDWLDQADAMARELQHWRADELILQRALLLTELGDWSAADDLLVQVEARTPALPWLQLARLQVRAQYCRRRGLRVDDLLAEAFAILPAVDERRSERRLLVQWLPTQEPQLALQRARQEIAFQAARGNEATQVPLLAVAARALLKLDRADEALAYSGRAVASLERVWPVEFSPFEAILVHLEAMAQAGAAGRELVAARAADRLLRVADDQVPRAHRNGFLRRHPVHWQIMKLAGRL